MWGIRMECATGLVTFKAARGSRFLTEQAERFPKLLNSPPCLQAPLTFILREECTSIEDGAKFDGGEFGRENRPGDEFIEDPQEAADFDSGDASFPCDTAVSGEKQGFSFFC